MSAELLAAVEESLGVGAAWVDEAGNVLEATARFERLLRTSDAPARRSLADRVDAGDRAPVVAALRAIAAGEPERAVRVRRPEPGAGPLELVVRGGGAPDTPLLALLRDAAERERLERHLAHSERLRLLGEMVLGCAHELNNLLGVILNATAPGEEPDPADLELARQAADDARRLVARLQSFGRAPEPEPRTELLDPRELVREAIEFTRVHWQRGAALRGVAVDLDARLEATGLVRGSRVDLRHALVNLVVNAIDAMPAGGRVGLECREDGEAVLLRVSDTGCGMEPAVRERIFEPFFSTKGERGLGLGLSLVSAVVARHDGTLSADSSPDAGSVFEIRLPRARALAEEAPPASPTPDASIAVVPCRILLVDDNTGLRSVLARILRGDGHEVLEAGSSEEVEELRFEPGRFDLALVDLSLPRRTGIDLALALQSRGHRVPVVLMTAWGIELDESARGRGGIQAVLTKPFYPSALRAAVADAQRARGPRAL